MAKPEMVRTAQRYMAPSWNWSGQTDTVRYFLEERNGSFYVSHDTIGNNWSSSSSWEKAFPDINSAIAYVDEKCSEIERLSAEERKMKVF